MCKYFCNFADEFDNIHSMKRLYFIFTLFATTALAQDQIIPIKGLPITAYELTISDTYLFYMTSPKSDSPVLKMPKSQVKSVRKVDGTVIEFEQKSQQQFPVLDFASYHGFLMQTGNCVYIPTDSQLEYELAAQTRFKQLMIEYGIWHVVDSPSQAHFVMYLYYAPSYMPPCTMLHIFRPKYHTIGIALGENASPSIASQVIAAEKLAFTLNKWYSKGYFNDFKSCKKLRLQGFPIDPKWNVP